MNYKQYLDSKPVEKPHRQNNPEKQNPPEASSTSVEKSKGE